MVSILDILSGAVPLMVDVRQSGGSPGLSGGKATLDEVRKRRGVLGWDRRADPSPF